MDHVSTGISEISAAATAAAAATDDDDRMGIMVYFYMNEHANIKIDITFPLFCLHK